MAEIVSMPKLGFDMAEGLLVRWVKKIGDSVNKGEILAEIETDKATVEVESPYSGVVAVHLVEQGTSVPVGTPIMIIGAPGEQVDAGVSAPSQAEIVKEPSKKDATKVTEQTNTAVAAPPKTEVAGAGISPQFSSPLARKMAAENKVDLSGIQGSGPSGRIVRRDIEQALSSGKTSMTTPAFDNMKHFENAQDVKIALPKLRSAIGRRMVESKQTIPHFYVTHKYNADRVMELRQQYNRMAADAEKLSINDFIIKAAALALQKYKKINASITTTEIVLHGAINIGVAVSVDTGLLTIVVKNADQKDIRQISAEVKEMAARARTGKVKPDDIEGSTFSISNLGMYDVDSFVGIINPPEAAILAVGSVHVEPVFENGNVRPANMLNITISADHRVTDGAEAAQFMQELEHFLENPVLLVM